MHVTGRFLDEKRKRTRRISVQLTKLKSKKSPKSWEKMGLQDVNFVLTAGVDRRRGWLGDVKFMLLSIDKPMKTGWKPKYTSEQAVRLAMNAILVER